MRFFETATWNVCESGSRSQNVVLVQKRVELQNVTFSGLTNFGQRFSVSSHHSDFGGEKFELRLPEQKTASFFDFVRVKELLAVTSAFLEQPDGAKNVTPLFEASQKTVVVFPNRKMSWMKMRKRVEISFFEMIDCQKNRLLEFLSFEVTDD